MTKEPENSAILKAEEYDAVGNHDEAINVLARATQDGNLFAKTRLAKRLLVGDRAPYLPKEGGVFIMEAANSSNAEAVALVAVFQCTGIYQDKSWEQAIVTLCSAATLGWEPAREQLLLLSKVGEPALEPELLLNDDAEYWEGLVAKIDLSEWLKAPTGSSLNLDPLVKSFPDLIPLPICRLLIRQSSERLQPALVYDAENKRNYRSATRTNSIAEFNLVENDLINFMLQERMSSACGIPMQQMEGTAILNYQPGQEISEHFDFVDPDLVNYEQEIAENGQRVITFLIYLNNEYTGGETAFPKLDIKHRGQAGEGLFFVNALPDGSSDMRTLHAGIPPETGEKWIVSQFIRNREVKYIL